MDSIVGNFLNFFAGVDCLGIIWTVRERLMVYTGGSVC